MVMFSEQGKSLLNKYFSDRSLLNLKRLTEELSDSLQITQKEDKVCCDYINFSDTCLLCLNHHLDLSLLLKFMEILASGK
jgi:hypothetical protein